MTARQEAQAVMARTRLGGGALLLASLVAAVRRDIAAAGGANAVSFAPTPCPPRGSQPLASAAMSTCTRRTGLGSFRPS